jgi:hypothetical protein
MTTEPLSGVSGLRTFFSFPHPGRNMPPLQRYNPWERDQPIMIRKHDS